MRRAYHVLHLLLIAVMLVAAVSMAKGGLQETGHGLMLSELQPS